MNGTTTGKVVSTTIQEHAKGTDKVVPAEAPAGGRFGQRGQAPAHVFQGLGTDDGTEAARAWRPR